MVGAPDWVFVEDLCLEIKQGISPCILEDFGRVLGRVLEDSLQWQCRALRDNIDPQGGDFWGSTILENLSWLFCVYLLEADCRVSSFLEEGNYHKFSLDSISSISTTVLCYL